MMKIQKWLLISGVAILLGAATLVAFSYVAPYALAQGPMGGWWNGRGDNSGPMFGRGFGPGSGMMGRGMVPGGNFGPGFGMGPGGGRGGMMDRGGPWGGPENSLITVAAEKLGMTTTDLLTELQAGKTIADVAAEKNVAVDTIVEAVVAPRSERLTQMVTAGQLTQEQADAMLTLMKTEINEHISEAWSPRGFGPGLGYQDENGGYGFGGPRGMMGGGMMDGGPWGGRIMGGGRWGGPDNSLMAVAAEKLGLTSQELATELRAGKSIAEIAKEKDIALKTIVDAVLAPRAERLNQLVTAGQLTQEEVDNRLANLRVDMIDWLNQSWGYQNTTPSAEPGGSGNF